MRKTKNNIKYMIYICIGIMMLVAAGIAYLPGIMTNGLYEFELTFLSNVLTGLIFITGGIIGFMRNKELPQIYYLNTSVLLVLVFLTCVVFHKEMNFSGAYFFLHVINPILAMIVFLIFTANGRPLKRIEIISTLFFPVIYLVYAITYGLLSGHWLYGFINIDDKGILFVLIVCVIMAVGIIIVSLLLYGISQIIYKKMRPEKKNTGFQGL